MHTQTLRFPLPLWFMDLVNFFAGEGGGSDKTESENEIIDDFSFGDFDDSDEQEVDDDEGEGSSDDDDTEGEDEDEDKSKDSAIVQKKKYREKLRKALDENKELKQELEAKERRGETLTPEEKKEKAAEEFLTKKIKKVLNELDKQKTHEELEAEREFQEELDLILEENTDLKENQVLDIAEELSVSPKQAVKVIRREMKLKGKEKPKEPQPKRGSATVKETEDEEEGKVSFDDVAKSIKNKIKKGEL